MNPEQQKRRMMVDVSRQAAPAQKPAKRGRKNFTRFLGWLRSNSRVMIAVAIVLVGSGVFIIVRNHQRATGIKNGTDASSQSQINIVVSKVGKLMLLPSGEQPTMAIVNDASKYSSVSFFKNAANGDRVLIYAQARQAILYRPSINKIIAVVPISPSSTPPTTQ